MMELAPMDDKYNVAILDSNEDRGGYICDLLLSAGCDVYWMVNLDWRFFRRDENAQSYAPVELEQDSANVPSNFDLALVHSANKDLAELNLEPGKDLFFYTGGVSFSEFQNRDTFIQRPAEADMISLIELQEFLEWTKRGRLDPKPDLMSSEQLRHEPAMQLAMMAKFYLQAHASPESMEHEEYRKAISGMPGFSATTSPSNPVSTARLEQINWSKTFNEFSVGIDKVRVAMLPEKARIFVENSRNSEQLDIQISVISSVYIELRNFLEQRRF